MANRSVTFELPEDSIAVLDEIAGNMEIDRESVLRDAINMYLDDYAQLNLEVAEADRQIEAGETISHEEVVARFQSWTATNKVKHAA